ncbi:unnamed protein product [Pseudo-nitzschia multistriata]|uniref:Methyltransferase type 11 domain-containing protein n=1 Tax=Pseudo-nitzschia multistriata TaxID=183589 RepID=A0A448ZHY2_9STRA|nr:unnamed protein product [Pseudo-nitzschia multistriata]
MTIKTLFFGSLLFATAVPIAGFSPPCSEVSTYRDRKQQSPLFPTELKMSTTENKVTATSPRAPPRTGLAQTLLNFALESPLWKLILVPQARANIVQTAEANEIPWTAAKEWIQSQTSLEELDTALNEKVSSSWSSSIPPYYQKAFHAYETGNLSWEAAFEVEIASAAVGARNFPEYGAKGEDAFRGAFESALTEAGANVPNSEGGDVVRIIDFGCGTGMSTRQLAQNFPQADEIIGVDLSPYFTTIGKRLLELTPSSFLEGGPWVSTIQSDPRIEYFVGDAAKASQLEELVGAEGTADVVNIQFVLHELPPDASRDMVDEAFRLLKTGGQLWICEMDFESPGYAAQRANPLLFSLIRSTEPYLDDYAESIADLFSYIQSKSQFLTVVPATGRHFALVATKGEESMDRIEGVMKDLRFDKDGNYRVEDTHLPTFKRKSETKS